MQLANQPTYKSAPLHVIPDDADGLYYKTSCGRRFPAGSDSVKVIPWPDVTKPLVGRGVLIICDKCWVKQDPASWKFLRASGCIPRSQWSARKLREKADAISAKEIGK